jgi:hypothetical protein
MTDAKKYPPSEYREWTEVYPVESYFDDIVEHGTFEDIQKSLKKCKSNVWDLVENSVCELHDAADRLKIEGLTFRVVTEYETDYSTFRVSAHGYCPLNDKQKMAYKVREATLHLRKEKEEAKVEAQERKQLAKLLKKYPQGV